VKVFVKGTVFCSFVSFCELEIWTVKMCGLKNTIVFAVDLRSPRISAYEIYKCFYAQISLNDWEIIIMQIDRLKEYEYMKFRDNGRMQYFLEIDRNTS
jgi:hypothetical protein